MSGWLALFRLDGGPIDREDIERSMRQLRQRGPHGEAVVVDGCAALGLTVLDTGETVPTAREPVRHGPLVVTGHARIDAREEVGRALGVSPVELAGMSDLKLLARALERYGDDVPARVFGEYAACAWDLGKRTLTVVRDAFGVRPAFTAHVGGWAIASNTLDAVRIHPAVSDRLDDEAILETLLFGWILGPGRTPFLDVCLAPAGGSWTVRPDLARSRVAWTLTAPEIDRRTHWLEQGLRWRDALDAATADRARGAKVSIALSGGIDSTAIAASAARLGTGRLYTAAEVLGHVPKGRDVEGDWAGLAARHLGIRHEIFAIGAPPVAEPFAWKPCNRPMPGGRPLDVDESGFEAALAAHGPVVLYGEGGDELWRTMLLVRLVGVEPWPALARGILGTLRVGRRPAIGLNLRGRLRRAPKAASPAPWLSSDIARRYDVEALLAQGHARISPPIAGSRGASLSGLASALWQGSHVDFDTYFAPRPAEVRLPMLDQRVVTAALRLPPLPGVTDKLAARRALGDRLPAALLARKKAPAAASVDCRELRPAWDKLPVATQLAYYVDVTRLKDDAAANGTTWETLCAVTLWRWLGGGARRPDAR